MSAEHDQTPQPQQRPSPAGREAAPPPEPEPQEHVANVGDVGKRQPEAVPAQAEHLLGEPAVASPASTDELRDRVVEVIREVYDPEIPVNIFDLGLIYSVEVRPDRTVAIEMTLTSPACPVAGSLPPEVAERVKSVPGIADATVEVVWDPPWHPGMMTEDAQLELGFM